jgi:membrane-bound lytic murein transglycosylase B
VTAPAVVPAGRRAIALLALLTTVGVGACATAEPPAVPPAASAGGSSTSGGEQPSRPSPPSAPPGVFAAVPEEAAALAQYLVEAERAVRDPAVDPAGAAAAGSRLQLGYSRLGSRPALVEPVRALVPEDVRFPFEQNLAARLAPPDVPPGPAGPTLPAWRIRAPRPAAELLGYYREAEALTGIGWQYLAAINLVETRMGRIVGVSSAGAIGPMQFLPSTWTECCTGDPWNDRDAIVGAATYLRRRGGPGDMTKAILGYNPNRRYLAMVTAYAAVLAADERAYRGYHAWQVFWDTSAGLVRLPVGYAADAPLDAAAYLRDHPQDRA